jgi:hypothetical protein
MFVAITIAACNRSPAPSGGPAPTRAAPAQSGGEPAPGGAGPAPGGGAPAASGICQHRGVRTPRHVAPDATDQPVVHPLRDLYQEDQTFANLFSSSGQSEICGPTSLTNVLLYLRNAHAPTYPKLFGNTPEGGEAKPIVESMFRLCHTDKSTGTSSAQLVSCASAAVKQAGYQVLILRDAGAWAQEASLKKAIGPSDLRAEAQNTWKQGEPADRADRATVLLFGWYDRSTYKRTGGHFVALAGYDAKHGETVYVTNPLINNYPKDRVYSKVVLEHIPQKKGDLPLPGMWQTEHLFGDTTGIIAVLEDAVSVLPKP